DARRPLQPDIHAGYRDERRRQRWEPAPLVEHELGVGADLPHTHAMFDQVMMDLRVQEGVPDERQVAVDERQQHAEAYEGGEYGQGTRRATAGEQVSATRFCRSGRTRRTAHDLLQGLRVA